MSVLIFLATRPGTDMSRQEIIEAVWPQTTVSEDSLTQCIADIRRALGDGDKRLVVTVPQVGYRLMAEKPAVRSAPRRAILAGVVLVLVATLGVLGFMNFSRMAGEPQTAAVAVLPLDDLSVSAHRGHLSDALSEGIIAELAKFPHFKVIARNSSFQFRDRPTDVRRIGRILGADYVVEGSQQYDGEKLRVTIQLIEAATGTHVSSDTIEQDLDDLFKVQDRIVRHVASTVGGTVLTDYPAKRSPKEVDSLLRSLKARRLMSNATRENWEKASALERTSMLEDPGSPWGYIGTSIMLVNGSFQGWIDRPKDAVLKQAAELAQKALSIAPENYMAHYAIARVLTSRKEYAESILHFERAIELNPSDSVVLIGMSLPLLFAGHNERAIDVLLQARSVDPLHGDWLLWQLGWAYWQNEECDEGLETMLSMALPPNASYTMLAALYACTGQTGKAEEAMKVFLKERPGYSIEDEIKLNPANWQPEGTLQRWLTDMRAAGMPG